ncbi:unnamed protein product, partial [Dovyalis caffra]
MEVLSIGVKGHWAYMQVGQKHEEEKQAVPVEGPSLIPIYLILWSALRKLQK